MTTQSDEVGSCEHCAHPFDDHLMLAGAKAVAGGIMVCPVWMCSCFATWSTDGVRPSPTLQYELYREFILGHARSSPQHL